MKSFFSYGNLDGGKETSKGSRIVTKADNSTCIETPALGRPFRLGMLYDRPNDTIFPGETLITMEEMKIRTFKTKKKG